MRSRKGVSKTIWIIIVIVIGVIAAVILITGFKQNWTSAVASGKNMIGNATDALGDVIPDLGGNLGEKVKPGEKSKGEGSQDEENKDTSP